MKSDRLLKISAIALAAFASISFILSVSIFFNLFGVRESEGNYVLFVVIANFICSLLSFSAAYGLWYKKKWTLYLLLATLAILALTFIAFLLYINTGALHEVKTGKALIFRFFITSIFGFIAYRFIPRIKK